MSARQAQLSPSKNVRSADHRNAERHIVADLGDLPVATGTGMKNVLAHYFKHGPRACKASSVPPTINVKVPAVAATRQRRARRSWQSFLRGGITYLARCSNVNC